MAITVPSSTTKPLLLSWRECEFQNTSLHAEVKLKFPPRLISLAALLLNCAHPSYTFDARGQLIGGEHDKEESL
jgi:hypothetical protein